MLSWLLCGSQNRPTMASTHRLEQVHHHLQMTDLPTFDELPNFKDFEGCAWEVWGRGDQLGTVNLLTDEVVARAAKEEIRTGKSVCLNWPLQFLTAPAFGRPAVVHDIVRKHGRTGPHRDDELHMNTQSGTQWDGLRHFGIGRHNVFYQGVPDEEIPVGKIDIPHAHKVNPDLIKLGIHNWAQHGISGRGILLDLEKYYTTGGREMPYDPMTTSKVTAAQLEEVAKAEGVTFRRGDILLLRFGFTKAYYAFTDDERLAISKKQETFAGIERSTNTKRFLWDNHFAAIASDQPAIEEWPDPANNYLHQTLLGLWGMPIGEFFDLEALSAQCEKEKRYTFFFSSWPLNNLGGVASPANAAAYF